MIKDVSIRLNDEYFISLSYYSSMTNSKSYSKYLSNKELLICDYIVTIPTFKEYRSLNLSAAVQIFVYELFKRSFRPIKESSKSSKLATTKEKNYFFKEFINLITETNFIAKKNAQSLTQKIHIIFNKAALDKDEINILLGIITSINRKIKK